MKKSFLIVFYAALFCFLITMSGCVSREDYLRKQTTGRIGCPPDSITIENIDTMAGLVSGWTAKCKGKTYYCSSMTSGIVCTKADDN